MAFIHDEFLLEVPEKDVEEAERFLATSMSQQIPWLKVKFLAEVGAGESWAEAKKNSRVIS